jgi:DNA-directed RNA polymerase specialized sigma24 family protein
MEITSEQAKVMRDVIKNAQRKYYNVDAEDLQQEAWRIALSTWDKGIKAPGYTYVAVSRELGNFVARTICPYSIHDNWEAARGIKHAVDLDAAEGWLDDEGSTPEVAALNVERTQALRDARRKFHRLLDNALEQVPEQARAVVREHTLADVYNGASQERAEQLGVTTRQFYRMCSQVKEALRSDVELWNLYEELNELGTLEDLRP